MSWIRNNDLTLKPPYLCFSGCSVCLHCAKGNYHYCETKGLNNYAGIFRDGGWAEYAVYPGTEVFKLPSNVTLEQGNALSIETLLRLITINNSSFWEARVGCLDKTPSDGTSQSFVNQSVKGFCVR